MDGGILIELQVMRRRIDQDTMSSLSDKARFSTIMNKCVRERKKERNILFPFTYNVHARYHQLCL